MICSKHNDWPEIGLAAVVWVLQSLPLTSALSQHVASTLYTLPFSIYRPWHSCHGGCIMHCHFQYVWSWIRVRIQLYYKLCAKSTPRQGSTICDSLYTLLTVTYWDMDRFFLKGRQPITCSTQNFWCDQVLELKEKSRTGAQWPCLVVVGPCIYRISILIHTGYDKTERSVLDLTK